MQESAHVAGPGRGVDDDLEPQDHGERDREQYAGHQRGDGGGGLAVRVGQPCVHRRKSDFGAVAEEQQAAGESCRGGIQASADRGEGVPVERVGAGGAGGACRVGEDDRAEECERDDRPIR